MVKINSLDGRTELLLPRPLKGWDIGILGSLWCHCYQSFDIITGFNYLCTDKYTNNMVHPENGAGMEYINGYVRLL